MIFEKARLKLTFWYLIIIMLISGFFSLLIYRVLTDELSRVETVHRSRIEHGLPQRQKALPPPDLLLDPNLIVETKNRLKTILVVINVAILGASAAAGYFLAGRTLKPIEEAMDDQRRFVADASHELRTPLTAIKTETEVALRDKKLTLNTARNLLKSNLEEADKLKSLTDYFLTLSHYDDPCSKFKFQSVDLSEVINQACEKLKVLASEKNIKIIRQLREITLNANQAGLTQLITILLDNAIKYSHKESVVNIQTVAQGNKAIIEVKDFGIGIKASDLPYIFNRFYRADFSRSKKRIDGYGLGLAIAKGIVNLHHGEISVTSNPNQGTIFIIKLPLKA